MSAELPNYLLPVLHLFLTSHNLPKAAKHLYKEEHTKSFQPASKSSSQQTEDSPSSFANVIAALEAVQKNNAPTSSATTALTASSEIIPTPAAKAPTATLITVKAPVHVAKTVVPVPVYTMNEGSTINALPSEVKEVEKSSKSKRKSEKKEKKAQDTSAAAATVLPKETAEVSAKLIESDPKPADSSAKPSESKSDKKRKRKDELKSAVLPPLISENISATPVDNMTSVNSEASPTKRSRKTKSEAASRSTKSKKPKTLKSELSSEFVNDSDIETEPEVNKVITVKTPEVTKIVEVATTSAAESPLESVVSIKSLGASNSGISAPPNSAKSIMTARGKNKVPNAPWKRIKPSDVEFHDVRLMDNRYDAKGGANMSEYGARASADLIITKGDAFRKAKDKKKKGSYRGGEITQESHSIKFD